MTNGAQVTVNPAGVLIDGEASIETVHRYGLMSGHPRVDNVNTDSSEYSLFAR